jgi:microcystin-dependent protein
MANYEATKYDFDGANLTGIEGIPSGTIVPWSDTSIPSGYLECAGAAVSRSTYATLFGIIGTTYGAGNGSTTFNVPDLQDNVAVSKSPGKTLGSTGGTNTVTSTGNVGGSTANATLSTPQLASHGHGWNTGTQFENPGNQGAGWTGVRSPTTVNFGSPAAFWNNAIANTGGGGGHSHNMSATFTGDSTSVVQPYLTVVYIIKT